MSINGKHNQTNKWAKYVPSKVSTYIKEDVVYLVGLRNINISDNDFTMVYLLYGASRIQSFPDCYKFFGGIVQERVQTGNASPPLLVFSLADKIRKIIEGENI